MCRRIASCNARPYVICLKEACHVQMAELQEQIEAVGRESQRQIELADKRKMLKSELRRLEDENSMQRDRISQMEHDLKVSTH